MMKTNIIGYLVLRKPKQNYDQLGRGAFLPFAPKINEIYYSGIDRMQWFDVDEDYYRSTLPSNLVKIRKSIWESSSEKSDIKLCKSIEEAYLLLEYCNSSSELCELVAINTVDTDELQVFLAETDEFIGCDLYCDGYGSLIREGVYTAPKSFADFAKKLNKNGLFDDNDELIRFYIETYKEISVKENLEILSGKINKVFLYRVKS